jgi:hypothetical protein
MFGLHRRRSHGIQPRGAENVCPNATPNRDRLSKSGAALGDELLYSSEPGVAFGQMGSDNTNVGLPNAAPLPPRLGAGSVGAMVTRFLQRATLFRYAVGYTPSTPHHSACDRHPSPSKPDHPTSELQNLTSELENLLSESDISTSELQIFTPIPETSPSEFDSSRSELKT